MPGRIAALQLTRYLGKGEPGGDLSAFRETAPEVSARDVECPRPARHLVFRHVPVLILQVNHHLKRHHGNAQFLLVLAETLLRVIWPVERLAIRIIARPGMIATHDKMTAAMILPDDRVPQSFARTCHAHGKRQ